MVLPKSDAWEKTKDAGLLATEHNFAMEQKYGFR
jgi:hypothetical protein